MNKNKQRIRNFLIFSLLILFSQILLSDNPSDNSDSTKNIYQVTLYVSGILWGGCVASVQSALTELEHVKEAEVSLQTGNAIVHYLKNQVTIKQMNQAISRAGFSVTGHSIPRESDKEFSFSDDEEQGWSDIFGYVGREVSIIEEFVR